MKARCAHGVWWFRNCPWCASEATEEMWDRRHAGEDVEAGRFSFWRNIRPSAVDDAYLAKTRAVRDLMDKALTDLFHSCTRGSQKGSQREL